MTAESLAHTGLSAARPAPDATERGPVRELRLVFSTAVQAALSTVTLAGPDGPVAAGPVQTVPGTGDAELRLPLDAVLPSGAYTVAWRTAGPDGHPIAGTYEFVVDAPVVDSTGARTADGEPNGAGQAGPPAAIAPEGPGFLPVLVRWLLYATATGMMGLAAFRWLVLEPLRPDRAFALLAFPALRRAWGIGWIVASLALALLPLRFGLQAIQLFGPDAATRAGALLTSPWGASWWLQAVAALLLAGGLVAAGALGRAPGWVAIGIGALMMSVVPALAGHASAHEEFRALFVLNDSLHVAASGAWIGGLMMVLAVGLPAIREADVPPALAGRLPTLASMVSAFSRTAVIAVCVIVVTGTVNAWGNMGSWEALAGTRYGRTLLVKLALVVPTALIGLYHWRRVCPALAAGEGPGRLRTSALVELGLAVLVLGMTALLAITPPFEATTREVASARVETMTR